MPVFDISPYPALSRLRAWFLDDVLPVWLEQAWDAASGHFHEGLALDGSLLPSPKLRIRTAARMIHVYADAERLGVAPAAAAGVAVKAFAALERDAGAAPGGYVRAVDRTSGAVLDPALDLYDQACVLLALASLHALTGEARYQEKADALLAVLDTRLPAPGGGWAEDEAGSLPRRQNPHMHLFEALATLSQATGDATHRTRLADLGTLMRTRFRDENGMLREFFGPGWEIDARWRSERVDPGHMAEWSWLLFAAGGDASLSESLLSTALRIGRAPDDPRFLLDEVSFEGEVLSSGRRLWPQAELIKASLATGDLDRADRTAAALFETYLAQTPRGTWRDRFDLDGHAIAETIPASSCYHLWTAVAPLCSDGRANKAITATAKASSAILRGDVSS